MDDEENDRHDIKLRCKRSHIPSENQMTRAETVRLCFEDLAVSRPTHRVYAALERRSASDWSYRAQAVLALRRLLFADSVRGSRLGEIKLIESYNLSNLLHHAPAKSVLSLPWQRAHRGSEVVGEQLQKLGAEEPGSIQQNLVTAIHGRARTCPCVYTNSAGRPLLSASMYGPAGCSKDGARLVWTTSGMLRRFRQETADSSAELTFFPANTPRTAKLAQSRVNPYHSKGSSW